MNKGKIIIVVVVMALVGALGMSFFGSFHKDPPKRKAPEVKRYVNAEKVAYRDVDSQVIASGRLASTEKVTLITEVQGQILAGDVPLKKGRSFAKGALLFRIFDQEARLALLAHKSRFLNAVANLLPDFKVDFPDSYQRWTDFLSAIQIEKELPPLPALNAAKEKIFLAGRNILSDYYAIKSEEVRLKKYNIYAPFVGTFMSVSLEAGSVANPGTRVAEIIRTDKMELEIPVEVANAQWIQQADEVLVTSEDGSKEWSGTVLRKAGFVDPDTQSIAVFVGLESTAQNPLYLGLYLKAVFPGVVVRNAMKIPRNAVFNNNEVFIVKEGRLIKREIHVHKIDEKSLIFSGLDEGDDLVVEPLVNARENSQAEIIKEKS